MRVCVCVLYSHETRVLVLAQKGRKESNDFYQQGLTLGDACWAVDILAMRPKIDSA